MLELNKWFFVLAANFLVLLLVLNYILFRPLLKVFKEREDTVNGSLEGARAASSEKERALDEMKKGLSDAARKAKETFEALRTEGADKQREFLSNASAESSKIAEKAKDDLRRETEKARTALRADVEKFSEEIVGRLAKV